MQVKEGLGHLIEDVFAMSLGKDVLPDECVEVNIHVLEDEVDVPVVLCSDDLLQFYHIRMAQLHQKHDLSVCTLGISGVIECIKVFLQSLDLPTFLVCDFPDVSIGSAADLLDDVKTGQDVSLDVFAH